MHSLTIATTLTFLALTPACCTAPAATPPVEVPVAETPVPVTGKRAPRSDANVQMPESGFWERTGPGMWTYDLGVGLSSDVQLTIGDANGRGVVRVALPSGAAGAIMTSLRVMYARNDAESDEAPESANGTGTWHIHADNGGRPGAELLALPVVIEGAKAAPLDEGNDGALHELPHPLEVPAVFWLVFERTGGDPRIGAMRLYGDMVATYLDLFYVATPDAPLGEPRNTRPYLAITFTDLGK